MKSQFVRTKHFGQRMLERGLSEDVLGQLLQNGVDKSCGNRVFRVWSRPTDPSETKGVHLWQEARRWTLVMDRRGSVLITAFPTESRKEYVHPTLGDVWEQIAA